MELDRDQHRQNETQAANVSKSLQDLRIIELQNLLRSESVASEFHKLIEAAMDGYEAKEVFQESLSKGRDGYRALQAAAAFGGVPGAIALSTLHNAAESGDQTARFALANCLVNRAVYPGTFDSITIGHRDLIERAARQHEHLIVAIAVNANKTPVLSVAERLAIIKEEIADIPGGLISVEVVPGMIADFSRNNRVSTIIRGVRAITDWDIESQLADANRKQSGTDLDTVFMPARLELTNVSSSQARALTAIGGDLGEHVSPAINKVLIQKNLEQKWRKLCVQAEADTLISEHTLVHIVSEYSKEGRNYHNIEHLYEMLIRLDEAASELKDPIAVKFATFFHDLVYDVRRKDNEERSAETARTMLLEMGVPEKIVSATCELILATKSHELTCAHPDTALFLDADMWILGAKPSRYDRYAEDIFHEYVTHGGVDAALFCAGRGGFLVSLEQRAEIGRIFLSDYFHQQLERAALENISRERTRLQN